MKKIILNRYSYIIENIETKKSIQINEIVAPLKKVVSVSQNPGGYGESSHQRSVLDEVDDSSDFIDPENYVYSSKNPICKKLLSLEESFSDMDTFKIVVNFKDKNRVQNYKILSRRLKEDI